MKTFVIAFLAFIVIRSDAAVLQDPSIRTISFGPDGTILDSATLRDNAIENISPLISSFYGLFLRTVYVNSDGELVTQGPVEVVAAHLTPATHGIQGPSTRSISVGPDGSIINSFASGGAVSSDGSVLVPPTFYSPYGHTVNPVLVHTVVPTVVPNTRTLVVTPGYYSGHVQIPYGKSIIAGPSGTIVAK